MKIDIKNSILNEPINFSIVALISMMLLIGVIYIFKPNVTTYQVTTPFESGDVVYLKLDSTKLVISYELGMFDDKNFAYRATYKDGDKIVGKFVLSSELFKNKE